LVELPRGRGTKRGLSGANLPTLIYVKAILTLPRQGQGMHGASNPAVVLVIDDEAVIRDMFQVILESAGYEVIAADSVAAGVTQYRDQSPRLVITDINMPGESGLAAIRQIRALDPQARIIAMSGGLDEVAMEEAAKAAGASSVLSKPFRRAHLLTMIAQELTRAPALAPTVH
jgi:CheY-like chemotaxis protein